MKSKSKVILVVILMSLAIGGISSAIYYFTAALLSDKDTAYDGPYASVLLQTQEFVNFIYNKFSSIFVAYL